MKVQLFRMFMITMLLVGGSQGLSAQEAADTTIVMDPADFTPHDDGYFLAGVDKDLIGDDGVTEHYSGCEDAYGDAEHKESGTQNGWMYDSVIIFRGCSTDPGVVDDAVKGTQPEENWPEVGNMIQLGKHKYALTDSASFSALVSPAFTSISSLTVKVSTDVSINNSRTIWMMIEASKDGGETWEYLDNPNGTAFIHQQLTNQGGDIHTYTAGGGNAGFEEIVAASNAGAIQLRIIAFPPPFTDANGERLKIWEVTIQGKTVPEEIVTVLAADNLKAEPAFVIRDGEFIAAKGQTLNVYTLSGVLIGSGERIPACDKGLFIVRTNDGESKKIYLK